MKKFALLLLLLPAFLRADCFPMFKFNEARQGYVGAALNPPITLAWKEDAGGSFYSSPAILDSTVYLGNSDHSVYAYDLGSGKLKWQSKLDERIYGSSPQIIEEKGLAIACVDGCVYTLDLKAGSAALKYCAKKGGEFNDGPDVLGSPLLSEGKLYFGSDNGAFYCFKDSAPDAPLWSFKTQGRIHDSAPALFGHLVFTASWDGRLYALDKDTGALAWKSDDFEKLNTTPMVCDGKLYFGAGDEKFRCLDASSGKVLWSFETPKGIMSSPSLAGDSKSLVFGGSDGFVYCLKLDGSLKWKFKTAGPVLASPLVTGNLAWIGSYDKNFYVLNMADGAKVFSYPTGSGIFSSAAYADGKVVVGGRDGVLYCFDAKLN